MDYTKKAKHKEATKETMPDLTRMEVAVIEDQLKRTLFAFIWKGGTLYKFQDDKYDKR